jgi:tRNA A-37 threonylcarbamoyl transferase component Bud32
MNLEIYSFKELKKMATRMDLPIKKSKADIISIIEPALQEYENYKKEKLDKYAKIGKLGEKGKEGTVYLVEDKNRNQYAMKTFNSKKSSNSIRRESNMQDIAASFDISPNIIEIDTVSNYIVMEKLDNTLIDIMIKQNKELTKTQQLQIIGIFKKLDEAGVLHGDPNPLNFMKKGKRLYIIDFGFARKIDDKIIKKYGSNPNIKLMTLGLILKLKDLGCPRTSYIFMLDFISDRKIKKFNL